jgi:hypothetical protein
MENIKIDITINGETVSFNENLFTKIKTLLESEFKCVKSPFNIKSKSDILEYHGITIESFHNSCLRLTKREIAYRYIKLLSEALNDGWKPDFNDDNQTKCYNWFYFKNGSFVFGGTYSFYMNMDVPSALYLKDVATAIYCKDNFMDLYKEYYEI